MSNNHPIDDGTKRDIDEIGRAYRDACGHEDELPPVAIDDAIRAAARRAVHAGPQPVSKSWLRRWTPPLALAAVVVLSVSVVFVAVDERPDLAPGPVQKITPARQLENPAASIAKAPPAVSSESQRNLAAQSIRLQVKPVDELRAKRVDQSGASGHSFVPPPEVQISSPSTEHVKKENLDVRDAVGKTTLTAGQSLSPPAYGPRAAPTSGATATAAAAPAQTPFPAAEAPALARSESRADAQVAAITESKQLRLAEKTSLAGAVSARDANTNAPKPAAAAPAPSVVASATPPTPASTALPSLLKENTPSAPPARAKMQEADASGKLRDQSTAVAIAGIRGISKDVIGSADADTKDPRPGPWLKRLQTLREQNKLKELREELARFQKAHPNVVLPKVLAEIADSRE